MADGYFIEEGYEKMYTKDIAVGGSLDGFVHGQNAHLKQLRIDGVMFDIERYTKAAPFTQSEGERIEAQLATDKWQRLKTLEECYRKPSPRKVLIWTWWRNWAERNGAVVYGVGSYNTQTFTFKALLKDEFSRYYAYVYVTKAHNRIVPFTTH